jgi:hypothetical protein
MTEILTVADHFDITGRGLVLLPDFDPPNGGRKWKNFSGTVVVLTPTGQRLELQANFTLIHFNIRDPNVDVKKRWRISVTLPSGTKQMVPIGSKLLCSDNVRSILLDVGHT